MPVSALGGEGMAGQANDFDGANDTPRVLAVDAFVSHRITLSQFAQQIGKRRGFQCGAQSGVGRRRLAQSLEERFEIEPGAAAQDRQPAPALDVSDGAMRQLYESGGVERLG